jgi:hypothetical protein
MVLHYIIFPVCFQGSLCRSSLLRSCHLTPILYVLQQVLFVKKAWVWTHDNILSSLI